jgi:unsaturated rhamnogalacturonyl hydrolase
MSAEPEDAGVAWGVDVYIASDDAADALANTRLAGPATPHADTAELAASVADALIDISYKTWNFGDSVCFEALIAASDALGDERWARFAQGWGRSWATRSKPFVRLDCTAPGRALVGLAERYHDGQLLSTLRELADYLMTRQTQDGVYETWDESPLLAPYSDVELSSHEQDLLEHPPPGIFVDCLHFDPPFLTALGIATGEDTYFLAGVAQALGYIRLLQSDDGLFDHFVLRGEQGSFGPGWGRGQGWAILGLLEVLESIDEFTGTLPVGTRDTIADSARSLLHAMLGLQREDGHWFAVVTEPESGDEFSTAGFMAWAIAMAMRLGVVEGEAMERSMKRARDAILASLDADGQLREVSAAVYASTEPSHYGRVPRGYVVPWGQGPALLALVAGRARS